jgi:outer membrane protein
MRNIVSGTTHVHTFNLIFRIWLALAAASTLPLCVPVSWATDVVIPLETGTPNLIGFGIGGYPDYLGSNDTAVGAAPVARIGLGGERFMQVFGTDVQVNLLNHPNWRLGPEILVRLGRKDVDDPVVSQVSEIDAAFDVGLTGGYTWIDSQNPLKRIGISAWGLWDASGVHNGSTFGARVFGMVPVARPVTVAAGAAASWGSKDYMDTYFGVSPEDSLKSGLPVYAAGSGVRDVRGWFLAMFHLSRTWHLGAAVMYSRLLGDASDSPLVSERGSPNQWVYGVGLMYGW